MRLGDRVRQQAFDAAEALGEGNELEAAEHFDGEFWRLDLEGDHAAKARGLALVERVARMVGQSDVVDIDDSRLTLEPVGNLHGIFFLALDAKAERLDAAQQQPRVDRRQVRPFRLDVELEIFAVAGISVGNRDDARDDVVVAADVLRRTVDDDVGAERQRLLEMRREEGVVNGEQGAVLVGERSEGADIADEHHRV